MLNAFRNAFAGLAHTLRSQRNARIHLLATLAVLVVGLWLGIDPPGWALLLLAMAAVWAAELFNTALEALVDLLSPEQRASARIAKDVSAAAVLVAATAAALIGLLVLGPPLLDRLR